MTSREEQDVIITCFDADIILTVKIVATHEESRMYKCKAPMSMLRLPSFPYAMRSLPAPFERAYKP